MKSDFLRRKSEYRSHSSKGQELPGCISWLAIVISAQADIGAGGDQGEPNL